MPPVTSPAAGQDVLKQILPGVVRPARYTDNEWNSVTKSWQGRLRIALVYPDVYEEGIGDAWALGVYEALNRQPDVLCERVYLPWPDMEEAMQRAGMLLYGLESRRPLVTFDLVLVVLPAELYAPVVLTLLQCAGLPLSSSERRAAVAAGQALPFVVGIGPATANPEPLADVCDAFLLGEVNSVALSAAAAALAAGNPSGVPGLYVPAGNRGTSTAEGEVVVVRLPQVPPPTLQQPIVPFIETRGERAVVELSHPPLYPWAAGAQWHERSLDDILATVEGIISATGYDHVLLLGGHRRLGAIVDTLSARYAGEHLHFSLGAVPMTAESVEQMARLPHLHWGTLDFDLVSGVPHLRARHGLGESDEDIVAAARLAFHLGWHVLRLHTVIGLPGETLADVRALTTLVRRLRDLGKEETGGRAHIHVIAEPFIPRPLSAWERWGLPVGREWQERLDVLSAGVRGPCLRLTLQGMQTREVTAALARGDRSVGRAIAAAWRGGMRRPEDCGNPQAWQAAFAQADVDVAFHGVRERCEDEVLPWARLHMEH